MLLEKSKIYSAPAIEVVLLGPGNVLCASDWNSGSIDPDDINDLGSY